jgi:hypothetical protein
MTCTVQETMYPDATVQLPKEEVSWALRAADPSQLSQLRWMHRSRIRRIFLDRIFRLHMKCDVNSSEQRNRHLNAAKNLLRLVAVKPK